MTGIEEYLIVMLLISIIAGLIGSLVGVGGGILIVPVLSLVFGVPIPYAIGASIVSVIATSSGSASAYVRDRITNLRIGMFLEIGTTVGAVIGALTTLSLVKSGLGGFVFLVFGGVMIFSAYNVVAKARAERANAKEDINIESDAIAERLKLSGRYHDSALNREVNYVARRVPAGLGVMFVAGILSGLLGVGGGILKVLGMDTLMKLPFKVSTTTSNFMIGVTAATGAAIFYIGGYVNPILAAPVAVGVVVGSLAGTRVLTKTKPLSLRLLFVAVLVIFGIEMILRGAAVF